MVRSKAERIALSPEVAEAKATTEKALPEVERGWRQAISTSGAPRSSTSPAQQQSPRRRRPQPKPEQPRDRTTAHQPLEDNITTASGCAV